ncbi:thiamine transporter 2-like [Anticarsia gemmatalis]|uniref:thiamine transporter 2-like n=1 Tax=Anticarsia gemmatalis TaxID=129554 RepID=UPI003F7590DE
MLSWIHITLILCAFGLMREIRPSEPFVSEFLLGEWRNITEDQLNREVYPIGTYSYLVLLGVVFLITDLLRFKPVIILSGLSGIAVYAVLLWTTSLSWLQASQLFYGLYMATEVAYYTYIYAKVEPAKYPRVSSYTRIAALIGRFLSGVSSQLLTHFAIMDYRQLNYITFTAQIVATFWAFWLPTVQYGIYFHRNTANNSPDHKQLEPAPNERTFRSDLSEASALIYKHARAAYSRPRVLVWSALYAVALALFVQAQTYMQILWKQIQESTTDDSSTYVAYNGAVEAVQTLLGAGAAYTASLYSASGVPAPVAALQALAVFLGTYLNDVWVSYVGYIVMGCLYHYTITLASAKIASQLSDESCFGLIFGINTLVGTALQSIMMFVLMQTLELNVAVMYYVISGLFVVLATVWLLGWAIITFTQRQAVDSNSQYS